MSNITIENLINHVRTYNACEEDYIRRVYEFAYEVHKDQKRQSGDPYISHPLSVAYILSELYADKDTICAAILHDVIEDSKGKVTREDIEKRFNPEIAKLVDGVTKISKLNFSTKQEEIYANTRKIIESMMEDIRIIIIKLADRLHNMRTLQYKSEFKQKENSSETMELYAPLAYYIGAYRIKGELEDLSLKYLKPELYKKIELIRAKIEADNSNSLSEASYNIKKILEEKNMRYEIKERVKNIYGIYNRLNQGYEINDIHDLHSLKIMVDSVEQCYSVLGRIHSLYKPINCKFKDYICSPKTNLYQSLHTTIQGPNDKLIQIQIRTFKMDKIASFGLPAYWEESKGLARDLMQKDLKENLQFYKTLADINSMFQDNQEFIEQVKRELFSENIYIYTPKGKIIELPKGSTLIDAAYKINPDLVKTMKSGIVNDKQQDCGCILKNKDRVFIETDPSCAPQENWLNHAQTSGARKLIMENCANKN